MSICGNRHKLQNDTSSFAGTLLLRKTHAKLLSDLLFNQGRHQPLRDIPASRGTYQVLPRQVRQRLLSTSIASEALQLSQIVEEQEADLAMISVIR